VVPGWGGEVVVSKSHRGGESGCNEVLPLRDVKGTPVFLKNRRGSMTMVEDEKKMGYWGKVVICASQRGGHVVEESFASNPRASDDVCTAVVSGGGDVIDCLAHLM
jgi:hypothetical protein